MVTGSVRNEGTATDWNTVAYALDTGKQLWVAEYDENASVDTPEPWV